MSWIGKTAMWIAGLTWLLMSATPAMGGEVRGRIVRLDVENRLIVIGDESEQDWAFALAANAKILIANKEKPFSDLKELARATVRYEKVGARLVAHEVRSELVMYHMRKTPPPAADNKGEFALVRVFYGTDRARSVAGPAWKWYARQFLAPGVALGVTTLLAALAYVRRRRLLTLPSAISSIVFLALVFRAISACVAGTGGAVGFDETYGNARGPALQVGTCDVSIPRQHQLGRLESPSILRFEFSFDPSKHVALQAVEPREFDEFFTMMGENVARSERKEALVFIHGYNSTFADAVRRTAQIAYDLEFEGAAIAYCWPSQGGVLDYPIDESNAEWTVPNLKAFLVDVANRSGAEVVHLVAHSMGNRALARSLQLLAADAGVVPKAFQEIVLAAPDIDADVFQRQLFPAIRGTARRFTLYASSNDRALVASKQVHGYPRAGESGAGLVVADGLDTIDVSAIDTSLLGHSYYGDSRTLIADLYILLNRGLPPTRRIGLLPKDLRGLRYWFFKPTDRSSVVPPNRGVNTPEL